MSPGPACAPGPSQWPEPPQSPGFLCPRSQLVASNSTRGLTVSVGQASLACFPRGPHSGSPGLLSVIWPGPLPDSACWQNSVPCRCPAETEASLPAAGEGRRSQLLEAACRLPCRASTTWPWAPRGQLEDVSRTSLKSLPDQAWPTRIVSLLINSELTGLQPNPRGCHRIHSTLKERGVQGTGLEWESWGHLGGQSPHRVPCVPAWARLPDSWGLSPQILFSFAPPFRPLQTQHG